MDEPKEHGYEKPVRIFTDFVSEFCVDFDPMVCSIVMEQFSCDMCMTYKIVVKLGYQLPSHSLCELMAGCFCPKKNIVKRFL